MTLTELDPDTPDRGRFECVDCGSRLRADTSPGIRPDCGSPVRNIAVSREEVGRKEVDRKEVDRKVVGRE